MRSGRESFALVPRRRLTGSFLGAFRSFRRGRGSDVVGSRPYRRGDDIGAIDWAASAKRSTVRAVDDFIVRVHVAEEAPAVAVVVDRRPSMALYPAGSPWLEKPAAVAAAVSCIASAAAAERLPVGYLLPGRPGTTWLAPRRALAGAGDPAALVHSRPFGADERSVDLALLELGRLRSDLPRGSFVFLLSDFLAPPGDQALTGALAWGLDLVPVVVQDPTWEASFPDVAGVVLPFVFPEDGRRHSARLSGREATEIRERNLRRRRDLEGRFARLGLDHVAVASDRRDDVLRAFQAWSEARELGSAA